MDAFPERVGRYEVLSLIGRGAMGVVYRARDPLIGREVALKRVSLSDLLPEDEREEFKERFFREARAAGNLRHPNVVTVFDVGESDSVPYMAMEYLSGGSLSALMKAGPLPLKRAVSIARQVALGLHYAHGRGIIHRDVKPDNILLDADGRPVVTDFGAAHLQSSELTRTGEVLGTPHYMSPEQILGEELDGRSDLFSLGVVFYLMVTGKRPFKGDTISAICYHIVHSAPEPLPDGIRVPQAAVPILQKLLAKPRDERFPDGAALAAALGALEEEPGEVPAAGSMTQTVCVPTPTPKPGTLRTPAPSAPPPLQAPPPNVPAVPPPPSRKVGIKVAAGLILAFLFLVFLALAILGGAWVARRMEQRETPAAPNAQAAAAAQNAPAAPPPPTRPAAVPAPVPHAPLPAAGTPPPPAVRAPVPAPRTAAPLAPKNAEAPHPPAAVAPAGPNAAILSSCEALSDDAARAEDLAKAKNFSGAFALVDRFPQRAKDLSQAAGPLEQAASAAAGQRADQAAKAAHQELFTWASSTFDRVEKAYASATRGRDDTEAMIRCYVQIAPVLRWKDRLPADLRQRLDEFAEQVKDDLDDDDWARAQSQAQPNGSR